MLLLNSEGFKASEFVCVTSYILLHQLKNTADLFYAMVPNPLFGAANSQNGQETICNGYYDTGSILPELHSIN